MEDVHEVRRYPVEQEFDIKPFLIITCILAILSCYQLRRVINRAVVTSSSPQYLADIPIPEKPIVAGLVTDKSISIVWEVHANVSCITHYSVFSGLVDKDNEDELSWRTFDTEDATKEFKFLDLKSDTSYRFQVAANASGGRGKSSELSDVVRTKKHTIVKAKSLAPPKTPATSENPSLVNRRVKIVPNSKKQQKQQKPRKSSKPQSQLEPIQKPQKPTLEGPVSHNSVTLSWKVNGDTTDITRYTLTYDKKGQNMLLETENAETKYTVKDLDPDTTYRFRVVAGNDLRQSQPSEMSDAITTAKEPQSRSVINKNQSQDVGIVGRNYRQVLQNQSELVSTTVKEIPIYQVQFCLTDRHDPERIRKFEFGQKLDIPQKEKVVLILGATGAGKSTLINGFLNYIVGVEWLENFRFKLVEESGSFEVQHKSQTQHITVYTLHHNIAFQVPYTLTIIDTPGFGDTEGLENDKKITKSICDLFKKEEYGIDHIDAIGFVAQSSLARLTPTQRYIFDSILSHFGADIKENIFLLLTFSDSQKPPILASVKEAKIPYKSHFKFNNSALFASNSTGEDKFNQMFWDMGTCSFSRFFDELETTEVKSLQLTKQVLNERKQLEVHVAGIRDDIHSGLTKLEQYRVELAVVRQHEADIERNKDFTYTVDEETIVHEDLKPGQYVTNCLRCSKTCHYLCPYAKDEDKMKCSSMGEDGFCKVCDGHCFWNQHCNVPYWFKTVTLKVTKTSENLQKRYEQAKQEKINLENLTDKILDDFYSLEIKVVYMTTEVKKSLARLAEIALRPNPLTTVEYLDILIRAERAEAQPGFQARIGQLENVKAQAKTLDEISTNAYDPFDKYRDMLRQTKSAQRRPSFRTMASELKDSNPSTFTEFVSRQSQVR